MPAPLSRRLFSTRGVVRIRSLLFGLAVVYSCATATPAFSAADPTQQLAAELLIVQGDARRLWRDNSGPLEQQGLRQRLEGALSSLSLVMRRAGAMPQPSQALRVALNRNDAKQFDKLLQPLIQRYRFGANFMSRASSTQLVVAGAKLHGEVCAGCHDVDWGDTQLPARSLPKIASSQSREEFGARLWLGVRGTREIVYANPFTDEELAALYAYYRSLQ